MDQQRSEDLARRDVLDGIVQRRGRGQDELADPHKASNRVYSKVRALLEPPSRG